MSALGGVECDHLRMQARAHGAHDTDSPGRTGADELLGLRLRVPGFLGEAGMTIRWICPTCGHEETTPLVGNWSHRMPDGSFHGMVVKEG